MFSGVIRRGAQKMLLTPEKVKTIRNGLAAVVNFDEIIFLVVVGWATLPVLKFQYDTLGFGRRQNAEKLTGFEDTALHLVFDHLGQLAKLALFVYFIDIVKVIASGLGFGVYSGDLPHALAKICYTGWVANRIAAFKRYSLARRTNQDHRDLDGQVQIFDRLIDAAIYGLALYVAVDTLQTDMGAATKSFLAFGSVSTLVVSLSMQGFVSELLHGLFLAGSNRFNEGDVVEVLGMKGRIENLGWLESTLRRSDVSGTTRIPAKHDIL
jgi:small-conductance mechanosensitive channel